MSEAAAKPQFHHSHLESLLLCAWRFHLGYELGLKVQPGVAAATGSAVHAVAAKNLTRKASNLAMMGREELDDAARDAFRTQWSGGVQLLPDEIEMGVQIVHDNAVDRSIRLARIHADKLAPIIRPSLGGIEKAWVIEADGFPWDLAGEMDVEEEEVVDRESGHVVFESSIRDLKTTGRRPTAKIVASSTQLSIYSVAYSTYHDGRLPGRVFLDYAFEPEGGTAQAGSFGSVRREPHIAAFWNTLEMAAEVIEKQAYTHARPNQDWVCTTKWCGFARINPDTGHPYCKFFSEAPTFVALSFTSNNGKETGNGNARRATQQQRGELLAELG